MLCPFALAAEGLRLATFHAELTRKGPGLLVRDILRGKDEQLAALGQIVTEVAPDVLLLTKVDFDVELRAAQALQQALGFEHAFAMAPNTMQPGALDLDGDGAAGDRQAWARYAGEGAMLLLSRYPLALRFHLNDLLWRDFDAAPMPLRADGSAFPSRAAQDALKVVTQGLWVIDVEGAGAPLTLAAFQHLTPAFDGPEDLNGLRNHAQLALVQALVEGQFAALPAEQLVAIGNTNRDPAFDPVMAAFLAGTPLFDPVPKSAAGLVQTAFWERPGARRVSYILPARAFRVTGAGVFDPPTGPLRQTAEQASRHRMVWVDIVRR